MKKTKKPEFGKCETIHILIPDGETLLRAEAYMPTLELTTRLMAEGFFKDGKTEDQNHRAIIQQCARGRSTLSFRMAGKDTTAIHPKQFAPGVPGEAIRGQRLPWGVPREEAEAMIQAAKKHTKQEWNYENSEKMV
jgi:hypothetical protein